MPSGHHSPHGTPAGRSWRRHRRLLVISLPPLAVVVAWVVLFALYWNPSSQAPLSVRRPLPPPDLNPGNIPVLSVQGTLTVAGVDSGKVVFGGGSNLCPRCPVVPRASAALNPAEAEFVFFFNLSNTGGTAQNVTSFGIAVSGGSVPTRSRSTASYAARPGSARTRRACS